MRKLAGHRHAARRKRQHKRPVAAVGAEQLGEQATGGHTIGEALVADDEGPAGSRGRQR